MSNRGWGVILAGGEGRRVRDFLRMQCGFDGPKQYCAIVGTRTMLQHTLDRIGGVFPRERQLVLIDQSHRGQAADSLRDHPSGNILLQKINRETAPSLLYSVLHAFQRDPNAEVGIFPSDHFVLEEDLFMHFVQDALGMVPRLPDNISALTVRPETPVPGHGWFESAGDADGSDEVSLLRAARFVEKPDKPATLRLFASGALVSTMVLLGRAITFLRLFERLTPALAGAFTPLLRSIGTPQEHHSATRVFRGIAPMSFSSAILEPAFNCINLINADGVYWSDWGDPGRIRADIRRFGLGDRVVGSPRLKPA